jgi:hypothetical protein
LASRFFQPPSEEAGELLKIDKWVEWARMTQLRRMEISRDDWKEKARVRADEIRDHRKARRRDREQVQFLKDEIRRIKKEKKRISAET